MNNKSLLQKILESHGYECESYNGPGRCLQITLIGERTLGMMFGTVLGESFCFNDSDRAELREAFDAMRTHAFGSDTVVLFPTVKYVSI